jgi:hypothetical protein
MTLELEFLKKAPVMSIGLRQMRNWILWRGRPPPKRKKEPRTEQEPVMQKHRSPQLQMTRDIETDYKAYHGVARDEHPSRRGW